MTNNKKIIGMILKAPLIILVIASFFVSVYAAYKNLYGISYGTCLLFGIIIVLYFIGVLLARRRNEN